MDLVLPLPLAAAPADLLMELGRVFWFVVCPMLLLMGLGYLIQRRMGLDVPTLSKINFYFCIPAVIVYAILSTPLSGARIAGAAIFTLCTIGGLAALTLLVARLRGIPAEQRGAMLMSVIFYNSGNYGLPLQDLAFRNQTAPAPHQNLSEQAMNLQVFVMLTQNISTFTLGVFLAAGGKRDESLREHLKRSLRYPPLYVVAFCVCAVFLRDALGERAQDLRILLSPFWDVIVYIKNAFIAIALFTLGAQLGNVGREAPKYPIKTSVFLKLCVAPLLGLALVYLLGLKGLPAQVLWISTTTPVAVNSLLLCLEFENHPDFVARSVFYSTLYSPLTVTVVVFLAQSGLFARLAMGG